MARGIFAALEDLEDNVEVVDAGDQADDESVRRETTDDVEMSSDQIGDLTGTIDQTENVVDNLMAVGDSLSENSDMPGVGIDEVSIKPTMIAVEALYRKLGISDPVLPSLESFADKRTSKTAVEALKVSIEEKAEEAKSGIRKLLEKAWNMLKALYEKIINAIKSVFRPSAERLMKKVKELKATEPKEKEVKDDRLLKAFGKPGGSVTTANITSSIHSLLMAMDKASSVDDTTISDLPFDTNFEIKGEEFKVSSGWDGKAAGDGKVELASKDEVLSILKTVMATDSIFSHSFKAAKEVAEKSLKTLDKEKEKSDVTKTKHVIKLSNELLKLSSKTMGAAIDYCNKSYKQIKANEAGKEEKK